MAVSSRFGSLPNGLQIIESNILESQSLYFTMCPVRIQPAEANFNATRPSGVTVILIGGALDPL